MKEQLTFKKLLLSMYKNFPNGRVSEEVVHSVVITGKDRDLLVKQGYLLQEETMEKQSKKLWYNLGPNALPLINSWKIETYTIWLVVLTIIVIILTVALLILSFV